jgi:hypothetical protein
MFCRLLGWALVLFGVRAAGWPYLISARITGEGRDGCSSFKLKIITCVFEDMII